MISEALHLFKYKLKSFLYFDFEAKPGYIFKNLASASVYAAFMYGFFILGETIIQTLLVDFNIGSYLLHRFIGLTLFIFFVSVNAGNVLVSLTTLYRSKEVNHLFTKPLDYKSIFIIKFLDNFFYSSATLFAVMISTLLSYGIYFNVEWYFYPFTLFFLFLPFTFIAGVLGVLILFLFIKIASIIGLRKGLFLVIIFYLTGIVIAFNASSPMTYINNFLTRYQELGAYLAWIDNDSTKFLPNFWLSDSLYYLANGKYLETIPYLFSISALAIYLFVISIKIADKFYYKSYLAVLDMRLRKKENGNSTNGFFSFERKNLFGIEHSSILKKEFWLFVREPTQLIHFGLMLTLIVIFLASIGGRPFNYFMKTNPELKTILYLVIFLFNAFLVASLCLRFIFPIISLEGEAQWKVRSAPIEFNRIIKLKAIVYISIVLALSQGINFFTHRKLPAELLFYSSIIMLSISVTLSILNLSFGAMYANYKEKNPIRIASSQGASTAFLLSLVYLTFIIALLFEPMLGIFGEMNFAVPFITTEILQRNTAIIVLLSAMLSYVFYKLTFRAIQKDI